MVVEVSKAHASARSLTDDMACTHPDVSQTVLCEVPLVQYRIYYTAYICNTRWPSQHNNTCTSHASCTAVFFIEKQTACHDGQHAPIGLATHGGARTSWSASSSECSSGSSRKVRAAAGSFWPSPDSSIRLAHCRAVGSKANALGVPL